MTETQIKRLEKEMGSMEERRLRKQMEEMLAVLVDQFQTAQAEDHSKFAGSSGFGRTVT
jgi:hypothetical protein